MTPGTAVDGRTVRGWWDSCDSRGAEISPFGLIGTFFRAARQSTTVAVTATVCTSPSTRTWRKNR